MRLCFFAFKRCDSPTEVCTFSASNRKRAHIKYDTHAPAYPYIVWYMGTRPSHRYTQSIHVRYICYSCARMLHVAVYIFVCSERVLRACVSLGSFLPPAPFAQPTNELSKAVCSSAELCAKCAIGSGVLVT